MSTIVAAAMEWDADPVVLGTHRRRGMSRRLLGSVAEATVRASLCNALMIPAEGADGPKAVETPATGLVEASR